MRKGSLKAASAALVFIAVVAPAQAADHGDTPTVNAVARHDANITDLHVFTVPGDDRGRDADDGTQLVVALSTNDAIPVTATSYQFPQDVTYFVFVDRHSRVDFTNAANNKTYGGTIVDTAGIAPDVTFTVTFDATGVPSVTQTGIDDDDHDGRSVQAFVGLRDDPFIRGPRIGRNVASIVLTMPLHALTHGVHQHECSDTGHHAALLVWSGTMVVGETGASVDRAGRALRSMFAENSALNTSLNPAQDPALGFANPDVVVCNTAQPSAYPNCRALTDDVVDIVADPRLLVNNAPFPTTNDVPFLTSFPWLAPPHNAPDTGYYINVDGPQDCGTGWLSCSDPDRDQEDWDSASSP